MVLADFCRCRESEAEDVDPSGGVTIFDPIVDIVPISPYSRFEGVKISRVLSRSRTAVVGRFDLTGGVTFAGDTFVLAWLVEGNEDRLELRCWWAKRQ